MIKILELFGGIGACTRALHRLNIDYEIADYVEIDKYAVKSYNAINNTNFQLQDITKWDKDIDVDLIMHGSPCQDFSIAGKQAGGDENSGTRSSLMYETLRIVEKLKPKYVIWENVKNLISKKHKHNFDNYINQMDLLGYNSYYQVLNAKDYGIPQNRERVFTVSIRKNLELNFEFPPKQELKLRLKDMLENKVDEKYYLSDTQINRIKTTTYNVGKTRIQEKDYCDTLCARDWKDPKCVRIGGIFDTKTSKHQAGSIYDKEGLSPTLDGMQGGWRQPSIITYNIMQKVKVRKYPVNIEKLKETLRSAKIDTDLSNTVIASELNAPITKIEHWFRKDECFAIPNPEIWYALKSLLKIETDEFDKSIMEFEERDGVYDKSNRVYDQEGLAPTLTQQQEKVVERTPLKFLNRNQKNIEGDYAFCVDSCNTGGIKETTSDNIRIRKLTPKECWRLMGFKDEEFEKAEKVNSNAQLYKQAGNSIVVNVLEKILYNLLCCNFEKRDVKDILNCEQFTFDDLD